MKKYFDSIAFDKRNQIILLNPIVSSENNRQAVASMAANIASLGYLMPSELCETLSKYPMDELINFNAELVEAVKEKVGANVEYHPMYKNFPQEVMEASDVELFFNAIIHYISGGQLYPDSPEVERFPLFESNKLVPITCGDRNDFRKIRENIFNNQVAYSDKDKDIIKSLYQEHGIRYFPQEFTNKENLIFITSLVAEKNHGNIASLSKYYKTPTDVLRYIVARNNGDITLSQNTRFHPIPQKEKRAIFKLLNDICAKNQTKAEMDIRTRQEVWKRVFHVYHPGKYRFPSLNSVMDKTYKGKLAMTFEQMFDRNYNAPTKEEQLKALDTLKTNPGAFARKLDYLLRETTKESFTHLLSQEEILTAFSSVAHRISPKVLLSLSAHFLERTNEKKASAYIIKGPITKTFVKPSSFEPISKSLSHKVRTICLDALKQQYEGKDLGLSGKVVALDKELSLIKLPTSQRDATDNSIGRGSRFNIDQSKKFVRGFIHWTDKDNARNDRVDIDLSAVFYNKDMEKVQSVSYMQLRASNGLAIHSGDITSGGPPDGPGVAEFVDINLEKCKELGIAYACFFVNQYTGDTFRNIPCEFGFMERERGDVGKIYEPSTVCRKITLTTDSQAALPVIFDVERGQFVWADIGRNMGFASNVMTQATPIQAMTYATLHSEAPSVYDVIYANLSANNIPVIDTKDIDKIPNDTEVIQMTIDTIKMDDLMSIYFEPTPKEIKQKDKDISVEDIYIADGKYLEYDNEQISTEVHVSMSSISGPDIDYDAR